MNIFNSRFVPYFNTILSKQSYNISKPQDGLKPNLASFSLRERIAKKARETLFRTALYAIRPFNYTGVASREIKSQIGIFLLDRNKLDCSEKNLVKFHAKPQIPGGRIYLSKQKQKILSEWVKNSSDLEGVKGLSEKHSRNIFSLGDLSTEESKLLNVLNFRAIQDHLKNVTEILNDEKFQISIYSQEVKNYNYKNAIIAEILAKCLAYLDNLEGQSIDIPVEIEGKMKLVSYQIEKDYLGDKLPYYVLQPIPDRIHNHHQYATPEEVQQYAKIWIDIRGTAFIKKEGKEGVEESIAADFKDEKGVSALPVWQKSGELLIKLTKLSKGINKNIQITGHSLGGTLAQVMSVIFHPFIYQTFAFNSPGVDEQIYQLYEKNLNLDEQKSISVFHRHGDFISSASPKRIGQNYEFQLIGKNKESNNAFIKHLEMVLTAPHHAREVDLKKDERNTFRRFSEWSRRNILSKAVYLIIGQKTFSWLERRKELRTFADRYLKGYEKEQDREINSD